MTKDEYKEQFKKKEKSNVNEINNEMIQQRRENGQCEICGKKLGMMDKMFGNIRCKEHR